MKMGNVEYTSDAVNRRTNTFQMFQSGGQQQVSSSLNGSYIFNATSNQMESYFRDSATQPADSASVLNHELKDGVDQFPYRSSGFQSIYKVPSTGFYAVSIQIAVTDAGWASFPDNNTGTPNNRCWRYRVNVTRRTTITGSVLKNWEGSSLYRNVYPTEMSDSGGYGNLVFHNYLYQNDLIGVELSIGINSNIMYFNNSTRREPSGTGFTKRPASFICVEQISG